MTPREIATKEATRALIHAVGGLEAAEGFCRVRFTKLSEYQSANRPDRFMPLDVVLALETLTAGQPGYPLVTRFLAERQGFALVKLPNSLPGDAELLRLVGLLARDSGRIGGSICEALADDGKVDAKEARAAMPMVTELIEVAVALKEALVAIERGE